MLVTNSPKTAGIEHGGLVDGGGIRAVRDYLELEPGSAGHLHLRPQPQQTTFLVVLHVAFRSHQPCGRGQFSRHTSVYAGGPFCAAFGTNQPGRQSRT